MQVTALGIHSNYNSLCYFLLLTACICHFIKLKVFILYLFYFGFSSTLSHLQITLCQVVLESFYKNIVQREFLFISSSVVSG